MTGKQFTLEQIVGLVREADARLAQGKNLGQICRELGITQENYYRCRMAYGEMMNGRVGEKSSGRGGGGRDLR
ncbi:MAG TPA: transposase [Syntrophales bacterium]|jgi:transposase-like protein|nr:transposase [Syntrophales bacterium]HRT61335.1 transposase [Syntrophales bacterium]